MLKNIFKKGFILSTALLCLISPKVSEAYEIGDVVPEWNDLINSNLADPYGLADYTYTLFMALPADNSYKQRIFNGQHLEYPFKPSSTNVSANIKLINPTTIMIFATHYGLSKWRVYPVEIADTRTLVVYESSEERIPAGVIESKKTDKTRLSLWE